MAKKKAEELPLESMYHLTYSNEHGPQIFYYFTRGMMNDYDVKNVKNPPLSGPYGGRARVTLEHLQKKTRAHLEAAGHPTDQYPIMPVELDTSYFPQESGIILDENIWYDVVKGNTEPLTKDRIAAELLHAVTAVLTNFTDEQANIIFRAMRFYSLFEMVDGLHDVAMQGKAAQDARAKGPQVKRERSRILRELIRARAEECWLIAPTLRGEYHNTAKKIFDDVNQARRELALGSKALSVKTIADHLRAVFNGVNAEDELSSV